MHSLKKVTLENDWRDYHTIRRAVLFDARGKTGYREDHEDEYKPNAHPLLLVWNDQHIGTVRIDDRKDGSGIKRMVAIRQEFQRQGHGRMLAQLTEDYARALGIRFFYVNAALEALGYYRKMGWHNHEWDAGEAQQYASSSRQMQKELV